VEFETGGTDDGLAAGSEGGEFENVFSWCEAIDWHGCDDGDYRVACSHVAREDLNTGIGFCISVVIENANPMEDHRVARVLLQ